MKNLPDEFLSRLASLGHPAYERLPEVIEAAQPVVSVRLNPARPAFGFADLHDGCVPWHPNGVYLSNRPSFTLDPALHQGCYYVQDASSMAVSSAVSHAVSSIGQLPRPLCYLDACAAPGGKTTAAIDALPSDAFVVANEFDQRRANILIENLAKWGAEAFVTRGDAASMHFPDSFFDIIAADVPCSGEGMMRKDTVAVDQWTPALVDACSSLQRAIVDNLWGALRPGGFFIYSTCTFNLSENEHIIDHLIKEYDAEPIPFGHSFPGVVGSMGGYDFPCYRFVPGAIRGEGLFIAMLRKPGIIPTNPSLLKAKSPKIKTSFRPAEYLDGDYTMVSDEPLRAVPTSHLSLYDALARRIKPLRAGIEPGTLKGRDFIPSQQLALSPHYRRGVFPEADVDTALALQYLRREAIALPPSVPKGIILLTYLDRPLGWVKNLGNRANNLYPENWRIRN